MSEETDKISDILFSIIQSKELEELEDFFQTHEKMLSHKIINTVFIKTCKLHSQSSDFESILNLLLLSIK